MVTYFALFGKHRSNKEIFRTCIGSTLHHVNILPPASGCCYSQSGFADSGRSDDTGDKGKILIGENKPAGKQLPHRLRLPDPLDISFEGMGECQFDIIDCQFHRFPYLK